VAELEVGGVWGKPSFFHGNQQIARHVGRLEEGLEVEIGPQPGQPPKDRDGVAVVRDVQLTAREPEAPVSGRHEGPDLGDHVVHGAGHDPA